jgi:hypothetical protein
MRSPIIGSRQLVVAALLVMLFPPPPARADAPVRYIPDCHEARNALFDEFQGAPTRQLLAFKPRSVQSDRGAFYLYPLKRDGGAYAIFAAPGTTAAAFGQGTWIVRREASNGAFSWAKVFLSGDGRNYLVARPAGDDRSRIDVVVRGGVLYMDVAVAIPFLKLLREPLASIVRASADSIDWSLFAPEPSLYQTVRTLVDRVRLSISGLEYSDDGTFAPDGSLVRIADGQPQSPPYGLNCSGFALWLADGLTFPVSGKRLSYHDMLMKRDEDHWNRFLEPFEESLQPYFGLDWSLNLARAVGNAAHPDVETSRSDVDVILSPFARWTGLKNPFDWAQDYGYYPSYFKDAGYQARGIDAILYILAIREPGRFYVASVSKSSSSELMIRRFFHVAVLFPYFDKDGNFKVAVFESAAETSIEVFSSRYDDATYVHLVRIESRPDFEPLPFPSP